MFERIWDLVSHIFPHMWFLYDVSFQSCIVKNILYSYCLLHTTMAILREIPLISPNHKYHIFTLFLVFLNSLYHELSGYVWYILLQFHFFPLEEEEQRPFCSFCLKNEISITDKFWKKSKFAVGQIWANNFDFFLSSTFQCIELWWNLSDSWWFPKYRSRFVLSKVKS